MFAKLKDGFGWFLSQAFGSDELTAYTAEYTWESNQMAHAMMGFALAVVWLRLAISRWERHRWRLENPRGDGRALGWCGRRWQAVKCRLREVPVLGPALARAWHSLDFSTAVLFALIPLKEVADILLDNATFAGSPVQPNRWPLYFDSITDISFWWTGMFLAAAVVGGFGSARLNGWRRFLLGLGGLIACVLFWYLYAAPVWGDQKRTFDQSGLPFNYIRMAGLPGDRTPDAVVLDPASPVQWKDLEAFREAVAASGRPPARHYVVVGGTPAQRSKLAVSMGCEYAFKLRPGDPARTPAERTRVKYVSAPAALERPEVFTDALERKAIECVVIDDLDSVMELAPISRGGSAKAVDRMKLPNPLPKKLADTLRLPENYPQLNAAQRQEFQPSDFFGGDKDVGSAARRAKFEVLGHSVQEIGISTIWVLTGDRTLPAWPTNRERWLNEIAGLVANGDRKSLLEIRLADPK